MHSKNRFSIIAFASCGQKFCASRVNHREFVPKFEKNGIVATTHGLSMWIDCWKFKEIGIFEGTSGSHGKIRLQYLLYNCCDTNNLATEDW